MSDDSPTELQMLVAELIGTFTIVLIGGYSVMEYDAGNLSLLGVAMALFLAIALMMYFSVPFSGGHLNPAVTFSFWITRKMEGKQALFYIGSQLLGSFLAAIFLLFMAPGSLQAAASGHSVLGFPHLAADVPWFMGFMIELVMSFILVFIFWAMLADQRAPDQIYGIAVGGVAGFGILAAGSLTGAAMNPARIFGPALLTWDPLFGIGGWFLYWLGPLIGATAAGFLYDRIYLNPRTGNDDADDNEEEVVEEEKSKTKKKSKKKAKAKAKAKASDE